MNSTDLALQDPQTLAVAQVPQLVARVTEIREAIRESGDAQGAEELRRRLAAYERYVSDKDARRKLEAESRRTEVLIGELSIGKVQVGLSPADKDRFRKLAKHAPLVEQLLAKKPPITKRQALLVQIERVELAAAVPDDLGEPIRQGDFRDVLSDLPDNSVDLIFTDPPYAKEFLGIYGDLAEFGARVLKPGGSLMAYCGQYALPQVLVDMEGSLRFWWLCACVHDGGSHKSLPGVRAYVLWKPIVWFVKDKNASTEFVYDAILRPAPDKRTHDWQQALDEPLHYIEKLVPDGGLVVDPCSGGGTTALAAQQLGRRFVGAELDASAAGVAHGRLAEAAA